MSTVRAKYWEGWNTSISLLFGKTPKIHIVCGNSKCNHRFSTRFSPIDFKGGRLPKAMCPNCQTLNEVPIRIS